MEASWIIGLPISDMTTRICFGIPHRVGACACEIGKDREASGVVEMTETSTSWTNCVANKTISPGHAIFSVSYTDPKPNDGVNDGVSALAASISCWTEYPEQLPGDPKLIYKTKGDVAAGVSGSFPSIQITLRPLKTVLDYKYTGNANGSGQGEIGFESQSPTADALWTNYYEGSTSITNNFTGDTVGENGNLEAVSTGYEENLAEFQAQVLETSLPFGVVFNQTNYFRASDRPASDQTPFQPLTGLEIDPTFHPRLPSLTAYDFTRNESFDYRHRFPADYFQKYGALSMPEAYPIAYPVLSSPLGDVFNDVGNTLGSWVWTKHTPNPSSPLPLNPLFEPNPEKVFTKPIDEGVAPVIKGWYWDSDTAPGSSQVGYGNIFKATAFKMTKEIRRRYPFSFVATETRTENVSAIDHTPGNQRGYVTGYFTESGAFYQSGFGTFPAQYYGELLHKENRFKAIAWWRMEVNAELCGWNSKKTVGTSQTGQPVTTIAGATIKGIIKLGIKVLQPSTAGYRFYSTQTLNPSGASRYYNSFGGITPSFVFRCKTELYFDEFFIPRYEVLEYDGGDIPWQVTLDKDNSKGEPKAFLDFPITSEAELPGQSPPGTGDTVPENSLVFIKDFVVTEVILP